MRRGTYMRHVTEEHNARSGELGVSTMLAGRLFLGAFAVSAFLLAAALLGPSAYAF